MRNVTNAAIVVFFLLLVAGCMPTSESVPAEREDVTPACGGPIVMTMHRDISRSRSANGIPELSLSDVRFVAEQIIGVCGGELIYGEIGANSRRLMERLLVLEPPIRPVQGDLSRNAFLRGEQRRAHLSAVEDWNAAVAKWSTAMKGAIEAFLEKVGTTVRRDGNDPATDIEGAVERISLALREQRTGWSLPPRMVVFVATDGVDTVKRPKAAGFPDGTTVIVAGQPGVLARFSPQVFESADSALRYIASSR